MDPLKLITDNYDRPARLYPALLLIAPIVLVIMAILPEKLTILKYLGTIGAGCGGAFLLAEFARDAGLKCENGLLLKIWGVFPSVSIFRHSDTHLDAITKTRYHKKMAALLKETRAPSKTDEQANPDQADQVYTAWSTFLRGQTRNTKKYPLLFRENVHYGYRRNVLGLRSIGIMVSALSCIFSAVWFYFLYKNTREINIEIGGSFVSSVFCLFLWSLIFTPHWVRIPADAYAKRLAETIDNLDIKKATTKNK
jgi:hypothetical protein